MEILALLKSLPVINAAWGIAEKAINSFKSAEEDKWVNLRYPEESGLQKKCRMKAMISDGPLIIK